MRGEFDSPSKPATSEYRDGWDRLNRMVAEHNSSIPEVESALDSMAHRLAYKSVFQQAMEEITGYPNGCPILENE